MSKRCILILILIIVSAALAIDQQHENQHHANFPNTHEPHRHHTLSDGHIVRPTVEPHRQNGRNGGAFGRKQYPFVSNKHGQQVKFLPDYAPLSGNVIRNRREKFLRHH